MSLWDDIQPYLDLETGLLMAPDGGKDNLQLYSAYLYRELIRSGEYSRAVIIYERVINYCLANQVTLGLYRRSPLNDNSIDNYTGIVYVSPDLSDYVLSRWSVRFACFDCDRPDWIGVGRYWFGRFLGFKPYLQACAEIKPNLINRVIWVLSCLVSIKFSKGASDPLLQSLQCDKMAVYCPKTVSFWRSRYFLKQLYSEYFGPNHPLTLCTE